MRKGFRARISPDFALVFLLCAASSRPRLRPTFRPGTTTLRSAVRLIGASAMREVRRSGSARRRRDQAAARLENLLALSGRFRRAAGVRFRRVRQRQIGDRAVAGAGALCRRRRQLDRLQGRVIFPLRVVPQRCRQAGDAAAQARLCGLREALRAGQRQGRACARRRCRDRRRPRSTPPRRACPKPRAIGDGRGAGDPQGWRDTAVRQAAGAGRRRGAGRGRGRSVRRRADGGLGVAAARAGRGRRRRDSSASPSSSTACRPARQPKGAALKLTATAGPEAIEAVFRLD